MSRLKVVWTLVMGFIAVKGSSPASEPQKKPLLLHPSLTSETYLTSSTPQVLGTHLLRKAKKTNFQALKEALLLQSDSNDLEDNVALETTDSAPYPNLPESYPASAYPVSLYATHTYVPPIKNLYSTIRNETERTVKAFNLTESSRTSGRGNQVATDNYGSITKEKDDQAATVGEIISLGRTSLDEKPTPEEDPFEGAEAEKETDFQPSNPAPFFVNGPQLLPVKPVVDTLNLDSNFGVDVTPIQVDQNGLKREVYNEIPTRPRVKLPPKGYNLPKGYSPYRRKPLKRVQPISDQVALEGYYHDRQVVFDQTAPPQQDSPQQNSLLYLSPSGPSMPVVHKLRQDLGDVMSYMMNGPVREVTHSWANNRTPMMARVSNALQKMMGGHMGDRTFDVFDWVPLIALIVATGLILSGLFPSGLGITNGNIILGRNGRIDEDKEMSILDQTLNSLETGVLMMSAVRTEDGCSARLACKLGQAARQSQWMKSSTAETLFEGIHTLLPERFSSFARSFKKVARDGNDESCHQECYRCIAI